MYRVQLITLLLVFVAASPVAAIAIWSISHTVIELSDPCASWDYPPGQPVYMHVGPHDACREPSVHTESKARAAIRAAIVPGGLLLSAILAVAGAAFSYRGGGDRGGNWYAHRNPRRFYHSSADLGRGCELPSTLQTLTAQFVSVLSPLPAGVADPPALDSGIRNQEGVG